MKLALFSDLHAHPFKDFSRILPNGRNSRLENALTVMRRVRAHCQTEGIKHVLFGGDLFHKKATLSVGLYQAVYEEVALFAQSDLTLHLVVGNHDQATLAGDVHSVKAFSRVAEVYDMPTTNLLLQGREKLVVRFVPYMEDAKEFKKALARVPHASAGPPTILVAHGALNGAKTGPVEYQPEEELDVSDVPSDYDFRFFGHYHRRQKMAEKCWYIGSPLQHSRGESGEAEKGFLTYDTETRKFRNHPLELPEFVSVKHEEMKASVVKGQFVEVEYDPDVINADDVVVSVLKMGAESVVPIPVLKEKLVEQRLNVKPSMSPKKLVENYVKEYAPDDLDSDELKALALRYLEGH